MQPKPLPSFDSPLAALEAGIAEANHRERGQFDGLLGQLPDGASRALQNVVSDLRDHLLDRYSEADARRLLQEYEPRPGFRSVTPVPDDVELALRLLNSIRSAMRCKDDDSKHPDHFTNLIFGKVGVRDKKRKAGSKKGGNASAATRAGNGSKAAVIIAAEKDYRGSPSSMAANIARKVGATPQYVRTVLKKDKGN